MSEIAKSHAHSSPYRYQRCFDETRAEFPTQQLAVAVLVDLLHVTHAPERIADYRGAMERGDRFPPISVVRLGPRFYVADGHKRFAAYRSLPVDTIVVEVWPLRRWLLDQWGQFSRKTRQQARLLWRMPVDRRSRAEARELFWSTVRHWRRVTRSLVARFQTR